MDTNKYCAANGAYGALLMKKISIPEESYWKLVELKAKLHCRTWKELIDVLYKEKTKDRQRIFSGYSSDSSAVKIDSSITTPIACTWLFQNPSMKGEGGGEAILVQNLGVNQSLFVWFPRSPLPTLLCIRRSILTLRNKASYISSLRSPVAIVWRLVYHARL